MQSAQYCFRLPCAHRFAPMTYHDHPFTVPHPARLSRHAHRAAGCEATVPQMTFNKCLGSSNAHWTCVWKSRLIRCDAQRVVPAPCARCPNAFCFACSSGSSQARSGRCFWMARRVMRRSIRQPTLGGFPTLFWMEATLKRCSSTAETRSRRRLGSGGRLLCEQVTRMRSSWITGRSGKEHPRSRGRTEEDRDEG